ncbi:MAG: hypothetical protein LBC53_05870 [Spirochaetaceae bacterium]|nr:hypothetical protein [Spirochaetaceae bacterium]
MGVTNVTFLRKGAASFISRKMAKDFCVSFLSLKGSPPPPRYFIKYKKHFFSLFLLIHWIYIYVHVNRFFK